MGQAKLRGNKEKRIKEGVEKRINKELQELDKKKEYFQNLTPQQKKLRYKAAVLLGAVSAVIGK